MINLSLNTLPASWPMVPLGSICQVGAGNGAPQGDAYFASGIYPFVRMQDVGRCATPYITTTVDRLNDLALEKHSLRLWPQSSLLIPKSGASVALNKRALLSVPAYVVSHLAVLVPGPLIDPEYLYYLSCTLDMMRLALDPAYPSLRTSDLARLRIPLPPLSEQQRIIEFLLEAEAIRHLRAEAEAKTATLVPAMFDAVFGAPSDWKGGAKLGELVKIMGGGTPSRRVEHFYSGPIPWATSKDIKKLYLDDTEEHVTEEAVQSSATNVVPKGTVLVVVKSKILANSLPVAITQVPMCFGQDIKGLVPVSGITPEFLVYSLQAQLGRILARARGANTEGLTLEALKSLDMPTPTPELVERFRISCEEIRALTDATIQGNRVGALANTSLSAHAFSGQLTADWREAHADKLALEARERDAALKQAGATFSRSRRATIQEEESIFEQRTDGIYSDLNREQRDLLFRIQQRVGGVDNARYFSAQSVSQSLEGSLRRNPQAIEGHLAVFASRGIIIPVSREEQTEDTGEFVFGNAYRLPLQDRSERLTDEAGNTLTTESGEALETESVIGDHSRGRELERLAAQLEKERTLT
jgi:type I restriction enzyme S subunit